jgi:hypothetical protein
MPLVEALRSTDWSDEDVESRTRRVGPAGAGIGGAVGALAGPMAGIGGAITAGLGAGLGGMLGYAYVAVTE